MVSLRMRPGSPAAQAGLTAATLSRDGGIILGDVVVAVSGKPVDSVGKLLARLDDFQVGDAVTVTVLREGKSVDVRVGLEAGGRHPTSLLPSTYA